jgi:hypothetical protein
MYVENIGFYSDISSSKKSYMAYSNITQAIETISNSYVNLKDINPKNNYFTAENMKYISREADESISGKSYYKYTFTPSEEMIEKAVDELKKNNESLVFDISNADLAVSVWIEKSSLKISKTEGTVNVTVKYENQYATTSNPDEQNFKLSWKQDFDYSFDEDIKMPIGSKISSTTDAAKAVDDIFGEGAQLKAQDARLKADVHELQNALEQYYVDNGKYPAVGTVAEVVMVLSNGDNPYLMSDFDDSSLEYIYSATTKNFIIRFKLSDQDEDTSEQVVGSAPNKYYQVKGYQE